MNTACVIHLFSIHFHYINEIYNEDIYSSEHDDYIKSHIYPAIIHNIQLELTNYYLKNIFKYLISNDEDDVFQKLMNMDIEIIHIFIKYFEKFLMEKDIFIQLIKDVYFNSSEIPENIFEKCNQFFEKIYVYKENTIVISYIYNTSGNLILDLIYIPNILGSSDEYIERIITYNVYDFYKRSLYDYFLTDRSVDDIYEIAIGMNNELIEMITVMFNSSVNKFEENIRCMYDNDIDNINDISQKANIFFQKILND
jgi:hypothetical protein